MQPGLRLEIKQNQQLVMTPQLQQAIKLLQMSTLDLGAYIADAVERNPLLEIHDQDNAPQDPHEPPPPSSANTGIAPETGIDTHLTSEGNHNLGAETFDNGKENLHESPSPSDGVGNFGGSGMGGRIGAGGHGNDIALDEHLAAVPSLREHIIAQIGQMRATAAVAGFAKIMAGELDEHGYLRTELDEITQRLGATPEQAMAALALIQGCEPTGVGARNLAECLGLQLRETGMLSPEMECLLAHLDLLQQGDIKRLRKLCRVDNATLNTMLARLRGLNPRPCAGFGIDEPETRIPDVFMRRQGAHGWQLELNTDALPRLIINNQYTSTINDRNQTEIKAYLSTCKAGASWLIKSLDQRAHTILKVATEIVRQQETFFDKGVEGLRPLTLRQIAEKVNLHESTISRVTANKYIATERGILELRFFFSNAMGEDDNGDTISSEAIRHRLRAIIDGEKPDKILSDDSIAEIFQENGIDIARRTVAKYRKRMNIPSSAERRRQKWLGAT